MSIVKIEKRYNADNTSNEEIETIKDRVSFYKDDIIIYKQLPLPTAFAQKLFFEKLKEIVKPETQFYLLIDLREVILSKPDSELREILKNIFKYYRKQIIHCCVVVGSKVNVLVKFAARIIMRKSVNSYSIHSDFDEALGKISSNSILKNIHVLKTEHINSSDDNVYLYDDDIIIWEESPSPDGSKVEKLSIKFKRIMDLSDHSFYIIFDLRKVKTPPNAEIREILKKTFNDYRDRLLHGCVIVPNTFMKITTKLVLQNYFNSISYCTKMPLALNNIKSQKITK